MFIKRTRRRVKEKVYEYALLVRSHKTEKGPRHEVLASLGKLEELSPEREKEVICRVQRAVSGQLTIHEEDPLVTKIVERLQECQQHKKEAEGVAPVRGKRQFVKIDRKEIQFEKAREAGPVHVGHQLWQKLGMNEILEEAGFEKGDCELAEVLTLNRLIEPSSEYSTPDWVERTALPDILGEHLSDLNYRSLYGNLDKLHPQRELIEKRLFEKESSLFNLDTSVLLYDLTSTYFEGECASNPAAKHGYSRDSRPDCRQMVVGLMVNRDGFPVGHEVFEGNTVDCQTVEDMLGALEKRIGKRQGITITVDRGMSDQKNLELIRARGHHYLVAGKHAERTRWLAEFEDETGWHEVIRQPSPTNPCQKKTSIRIKRFEKGSEVCILCVSDERIEKDRAIRQKQEAKLHKDLEKLQKRVDSGKLKTVKKVYEAIGRLKERYPRVARYYRIDLNETSNKLNWAEETAKKAIAEKVDGGYLLKTTRKDLTDDEIWQTYMLLTRVESAFRDMKSPLAMRPIFHQLQERAESHIFVCVLAYHLLVAVEKLLHDSNMPVSWETVRKELSTHQVVSGVFVTDDQRRLEVRRDTTPEPAHERIYQALKIPGRVFPSPVERWTN